MRGYEQQDAHEFLSLYLDRLDAELRGNVSLVVMTTDQQSEWSLVGNTFQGTLRSVVTCSSCDRESITNDPFRVLSLDIPTSGLLLTRQSPMRRSVATPRFAAKCTLFECLDLFTHAEPLEGYVYECVDCRHKTQATKQFYFGSVPPILSFHIKRFAWSSISRSKVCTHVAFPLKLDLSLYMPDKCDDIYELRSVVCHHGEKLSVGHYTSYVWDDLYGTDDRCSINVRQLDSCQ